MEKIENMSIELLINKKQMCTKKRIQLVKSNDQIQDIDAKTDVAAAFPEDCASDHCLGRVRRRHKVVSGDGG